MYRRSAAGDAVAGANSPGEPLAFLAAHTFGGRKLYPGAVAFGLVASCETPWALTLAQPDVAPARVRDERRRPPPLVISRLKVVVEDSSRTRVLGPPGGRVRSSRQREFKPQNLFCHQNKLRR